jgi:hypothetical protein
MIKFTLTHAGEVLIPKEVKLDHKDKAQMIELVMDGFAVRTNINYSTDTIIKAVRTVLRHGRGE